MDSVIAVAVINGAVSIVSATLAYLGVRRKLDDQHGATQSIVGKLDEVRAVNANQIVASNNFNQKFAKLEAQNAQVAREVHETRTIVRQMEGDIKTLATETGIAIGR